MRSESTSRDRWLVIHVHSSSESDLDTLAEELIAMGGSAVEVERDRLTTYLPRLEYADLEEFADTARARLQAAIDGREVELSWEWKADEDWSRRWKRGLKPRRVGERIIVTPSWGKPRPRVGDVVLTIDPEMAFGTGEHATTRSALRLLQEALKPGDRVLDVGAGSAILAIAAARLGAGRVHAVESDGEAIGNAADNIGRNGANGRVELIQAIVDEAYLAECGAGSFDLILANVLSSVLEPLLPAFREALAGAGRLVLAGILEPEAERMITAASRAGLELVREDLEAEWWAGLFRR